MRLAYALLSPTFGVHQGVAHLTDRMNQAGHDVHLVTTTNYPADRYHPAISVHTPVTTRSTGLSRDALRFSQIRHTQLTLRNLKPDVVHFTGPHLWNAPLLWLLRRAGIPTVHTLHDLDPHAGTSRLLYLWNRLVLRLADHILVHGQCYQQRLLDMGLSAEKVTYTPVLHLFLSHTYNTALEDSSPASERPTSHFEFPISNSQLPISYEPWALFFGRLERYKGVEHLLRAAAALDGVGGDGPTVVLAGKGSLEQLWAGPLPPRVELRDHLVGDEEALDLFRRCGLLVLPYTAATQSALVAAAYFFRKPVLVTRSGALPEYVQEGQTGWVVEPGSPTALAERLTQALADPARLARMGQAGRAWYEQQRRQEGETLLRMYQHVAGVGKGSVTGAGE